MARPRKADQIDIPARAVAATIDLLDRYDPSAITLALVAEEVGCSAPALYSHFANKDALLRTVHDAGFRLMLEEKLVLAARHANDAFARLRAGGLAYLQFAFERPGLYRLMFSPPPTEGLPDSPFAADPGAKCLEMLETAVRACQADGYLPGMESTRIAFTLWSTVHGAADLVRQGRAPLQDDRDAKASAEKSVETLMAFIRSTKP